VKDGRRKKKRGLNKITTARKFRSGLTHRGGWMNSSTVTSLDLLYRSREKREEEAE